MSNSRNVVHASVQFVDIGGLVEGASKGEGLGNRFLAHIREVDAVVYVLRAFEDADVRARPTRSTTSGSSSSSCASPTSRRSRSSSSARRSRRRSTSRSLAEAAGDGGRLRHLADGTPLYRSALSAEHRGCSRPMFLLTNRPGAGRRSTSTRTQLAGPTRSRRRCGPSSAPAPRSSPCACSSRPRPALLDAEDRAEMLEGFGLGEGALPRFVQSAYHLLGLRTFLTTGDKESRAWTFRAGAKAPEAPASSTPTCSGASSAPRSIHWDELLEIGSWSKARELGKLRVEGKDYEVQDGDVLEIRHNS